MSARSQSRGNQVQTQNELKPFFQGQRPWDRVASSAADPNLQKSQELGIETTGPFLGPASNLHRRARGPRLVLPRQPKRSKNPSQDLPLSTSPYAADASPGAFTWSLVSGLGRRSAEATVQQSFGRNFSSLRAMTLSVGLRPITNRMCLWAFASQASALNGPRSRNFKISNDLRSSADGSRNSAKQRARLLTPRYLGSSEFGDLKQNNE